MSKKYKNLELKKQFDDMIYEIVKTRTLDNSEEVNNLIKKISPQIEKINNLLNEKTILNEKTFAEREIVFPADLGNEAKNF